MALPDSRPRPIESWRWRIVGLLFLATMINYMDRLALYNTQRYLLPEFEPDPEKRNLVYANINFAFGLSFGLFQIVAGFLIDRFSLRWLYLGAIVVWSLAGLLTGFVPAGAVAALMALRVVLGLGEAFNWPCAVACIRRMIPRESRSVANGFFHSGASLGAIATPFLVLLFVDTSTGEGWRTVFISVGAVGVLWAILWMVQTRGERGRIIDAPPTADPGYEAEPARSFAHVLGLHPFWICLGTGICVNLCWHFYNQWFPRYLTEDIRLSGPSEQWILAGFYVAADLGSLFSGWLIRKRIRGGRTVETSRKQTMLFLAIAVFCASMPAAFISSDVLWAKFAFFYIVAAAAMGGFAIFFSLAQDIVPRHTAQILGVCGCMSWLVISGVTKMIGDFQLAGPGKYADLFALVGCVPLIAAIIGWQWKEPSIQSRNDLPHEHP